MTSVLLLAKSTGGVIHVDNITSPSSFVTVKEQKWASGWTAATAYQYQNNTYLLRYKQSSGKVSIKHVISAASFKEIGERFFIAKNWTSITCYQFSGQSYLLNYNANTGEACVESIIAPNVFRQVGEKFNFGKGWTSITTYQCAGYNMLLRYASKTGLLGFDKIESPESCTSFKIGIVVQPKGWATGWSSISSYQYGGDNYLFKYKSESGQVHIDKIKGCCSFKKMGEAFHLSPGWTIATQIHFKANSSPSAEVVSPSTRFSNLLGPAGQTTVATTSQPSTSGTVSEGLRKRTPSVSSSQPSEIASSKPLVNSQRSSSFLFSKIDWEAIKPPQPLPKTSPKLFGTSNDPPPPTGFLTITFR